MIVFNRVCGVGRHFFFLKDKKDKNGKEMEICISQHHGECCWVVLFAFLFINFVLFCVLP